MKQFNRRVNISSSFSEYDNHKTDNHNDVENNEFEKEFCEKQNKTLNQLKRQRISLRNSGIFNIDIHQDNCHSNSDLNHHQDSNLNLDPNLNSISTSSSNVSLSNCKGADLKESSIDPEGLISEFKGDSVYFKGLSVDSIDGQSHSSESGIGIEVNNNSTGSSDESLSRHNYKKMIITSSESPIIKSSSPATECHQTNGFHQPNGCLHSNGCHKNECHESIECHRHQDSDHNKTINNCIVTLPSNGYYPQNNCSDTKLDKWSSSISPGGHSSLDSSQIKSFSKLTFLKGILLAFSSSIFFSLTTLIVKVVDDIHPSEIACFRFLGIMLFSIPVLLESRKHPFAPSWNARMWLVLRGLSGATSLYLRYLTLRYLPIGDATVIVLSMPVFVFIFARIFLKESCGIFHVIALAVTLIGISFTAKLNIIFGSDSDELSKINKDNEMIGLLCAMGATLVGSAVYVIVRKVKGLHHSVILFNFSLVAIMETSIITYSLGEFKLPKTSYGPWLLMLVGILSFYGQLMLTKALQAEEAGLVSVTRASSEVIFAFLFQIAIFKEIPDMWSVLGAFLVTLSVMLTSSRKWIQTLPSESKFRKALNFVTK